MPPLTSESESESVLGPGGGRENGDRAEPEKADGEGPAGEAAGARKTKSRELPSGGSRAQPGSSHVGSKNRQFTKYLGSLD